MGVVEKCAVPQFSNSMREEGRCCCCVGNTFTSGVEQNLHLHSQSNLGSGWVSLQTQFLPQSLLSLRSGMLAQAGRLSCAGGGKAEAAQPAGLCAGSHSSAEDKHAPLLGFKKKPTNQTI